MQLYLFVWSSLISDSWVPILGIYGRNLIKNGSLFSPNFKLQKSFLDSALARKVLGSQEPFWCRFANIQGRIKSFFFFFWRFACVNFCFGKSFYFSFLGRKIGFNPKPQVKDISPFGQTFLIFWVHIYLTGFLCKFAQVWSILSANKQQWEGLYWSM